MIRSFLFFVIVLFSLESLSQKREIDTENISSYFDEIKSFTQKYNSLWDMDLYGPIILIDTETRVIYANESDSSNVLLKSENIYTGILPSKMNFANTAIDWGGKKWAMIMLPLSQNKFDRINLMAHELFHRVQSQLGFTMRNVENNHLDEKEGRIYLRLELESLKESFKAKNKQEEIMHLTNAFIFRKYRNQIFPGSNLSENTLELNEGIAEYTGQVISGRNSEQAKDNFIRSIEQFMSNPTYVRSFAYQTTPAYGFFLKKKINDWNKEISQETNLTDFFIEKLDVEIPRELQDVVINLTELYNSSRIISEETNREEEKLKLLAQYKQTFIEESHLVIPLKNMNISFDPSNIIAFENIGSVHATARVSDNWGVLDVSKGMLMSSDWKAIYLSKPTEISKNHVAGDGWYIELEGGYIVVSKDNDFILIAND